MEDRKTMAPQNEQTSIKRTLNLTELRDWCMERISYLSLHGGDIDAQAITDEHLELLRCVDSETTLWMSIERID